MHFRQHDLKPLVRRLAESFGALAKSRGITLEATIPAGPVPARVDADQIEKVLANLLSNALKFTPAGGHVRFTIGATEGEPAELIAMVEDDGPGIPEEMLADIFERFHQVDDSSKRAHEGAGLGLALVKEITELHGGTVEVWSEPGRGSRFTVRLPRDAATESQWPTEVARDTDSAVPATTAAGTARSTRPTARGDDDERPTVLIVEDHADLRAYLRRHLEDAYDIVEAANGRAGLDEARRMVPDLILCDIMMPVMDGEELCRAVRADPELAYLPVIMVTARASRQSRLSALEGGADDYLVKPFDPRELRLRVGNALASRRRFAERLREEGKALPFVALDLPDHGSARDFATSLEAVLREHMGEEDFDVDEMADALAMSRATLYRKADEALATTPKELLWTFRLNHAAQWLRETDGTVSEVAYASGFKTVPHFTRRFKERFGTTPAAYRRQRG